MAKQKGVKRSKRLDTLWSQVVRKRDKVCRKCRKAPASQGAHIFGRSHYKTRWNPLNGLGMCYYCHIHWAHREPVEFTLWVIGEIGKRTFNRLKKESLDKNYTFHHKDEEKIKKKIK